MAKIYWFDYKFTLKSLNILMEAMRTCTKDDKYRQLLISVWVYELLIKVLMLKYYKSNSAIEREDKVLTVKEMREDIKSQEKTRELRMIALTVLSDIAPLRVVRRHVAHFNIDVIDSMLIAFYECSDRVYSLIVDVFKVQTKFSLMQRNELLENYVNFVKDCAPDNVKQKLSDKFK